MLEISLKLLVKLTNKFHKKLKENNYINKEYLVFDVVVIKDFKFRNIEFHIGDVVLRNQSLLKTYTDKEIKKILSIKED